MAKEIDGKIFLDLEEVKERYGWPYATLYFFVQKGLLSKPVKFHTDKKGYWPKEELDRIKNRPREESQRGFKGNPSVPRIFQDPAAAQEMLDRIKSINSIYIEDFKEIMRKSEGSLLDPLSDTLIVSDDGELLPF